MPSRDWQLRIEDILEAIEKIERYTQGLGYAAWLDDEKTVDAVVRNIEIIGEASSHIPDDVLQRYANPLKGYSANNLLGNPMDREKIIERLSNNQPMLRKFGVKSIRLFGSFARDDAAPGSDVDLLVEFESTARVGLFEFLRLKQELSGLLGREVDLATPGALHKAMKDQILKEAKGCAQAF